MEPYETNCDATDMAPIAVPERQCKLVEAVDQMYYAACGLREYIQHTCGMGAAVTAANKALERLRALAKRGE